MEQRFQEYGQKVCAHIRHATFEEKRLIKKELTDHMEDHAQVLLDAGYSEEDALDLALSAMGDPEEVGRELDKEYPFRWLLLSRLLIGVVTVLVLYFLMLLPIWWPGSLIDQLQVRLDPAGGHGYTDVAPSFQPLDLRRELPGGTILYIYGVSLEGGSAEVYTVTYPKNPFALRWNHVTYLDFSYTLNGVETPHKSKSGEGQLMYFRHSLTGLPEGCSLIARYQRYSADISFQIPLPWEEAVP